MRGDDQLELSRRDFMLAGTTSMLALDSDIQPQLETENASGSGYEFQGVADLIGPAAARPEPGSGFFENKIAYAYRYQETDGKQYKWFITEDDDRWQNLSMQLDQYSTPYDSLKTAKQFTQFAVDPSKGLTRRRYQWFSNNTLFDKTLFQSNRSTGTIDISTGSSSANTARMNTSISGQYLSQSLAQPGIGLDIDDSNRTIDADGFTQLSHGSIALGVGWHDGSSGGWDVGGPIQTFLGIRYTSTGAEAVLISDGQHIGDSPVPQSEWNLDRMNGADDNENPTGYQLDPSKGYVYQMPYTWYGHGSLYVGVAHPESDEIVRFHKFNVPRTSFDRPNMPPIVLIDDGGTAADLTAKLGGMQYAIYGSQLGEDGTEERGTEVTRTEFTITTPSTDTNGSVDPVAEPGDPVISFKRVENIRDISLRLQNFFAELNNPIWIFSWDEYEPGVALTNANFRDPNESVYPNDETKMLVDTAATDYTPETAVTRGIDFIYTDKNQNSLLELDTDDRVPIDATRVITAATEGTDATVDPAQVRAVEGY